MTAVWRRVAVVVLACLPLEAAWFRGNTHAHTNLSDGQDPPELVAKWYQQHGYDFLFITDHNGVSPVAGLNNVFGNGGRFLILPGEEVTSDFGRWRVHVNALGAQRKATPQTGRTAAEGLQRTIDAARGSGGLAQINHPNFFWSLTADDIAATKGANLLEVFNGNPGVNTYGAGSEAPGAEQIWDRVLSKGVLLYAVASDDMHSLNRTMYPEWSLPGRGWIMVNAARLGAAEIMEAIERGDFYATTGVEIAQYSAAGGQIAVGVAAKDQVKYLIEFIGRDGKVLQQTSGPSATYRIDGSEGYVRARVTDSNNHRAWMQPVMGAKTEAPVTVAAPPAPPVVAGVEAAGVEAAAATARSGDFKAALAALRKSGSSVARTLVVEAALARNLGDAGAPRAITRALALDPKDSAARFEQSLQGANSDTLWDYLAADAERILEVADLYMRWGLYEDAATILARSYPSIPEDRLEPGAVPPGMDPLVSYYLGYCHERMKRDAADYYRGGSQLPIRNVFPRRASSRQVLEAAIRSNPEDAGAHYLLGLWFLNAKMVTEAGRELQVAQKLRPTLEEARTLLLEMKLPVTAATREAEPAAPAIKAPTQEAPAKIQEPAPVAAPVAAQAAAPAPRTTPPSATPVGSPAEAAAEALMAAAEGDLGRARAFFTAVNFPAEKQEDSVREAYIELELQRLLALAADKKCAEVDRMLTNIGAYDKTLPFTFHPFNSLMKGARFQYYLGEAAAACDEKEARKIWEKVSKMRPDLASTDFAFPFMAATRLQSPSEPVVGLDHIRRYLLNASGATRSALFYNQGMLLLVGGRRQDAVDCFRSGLRGAPPGMLRYLNTLALRQAEQ